MTTRSAKLPDKPKKTTPPPVKAKSIIAFQPDRTACVVIFPHAPELSPSEKTKIGAASRIRFFVYGCSEIPVPSRKSPVGDFGHFPAESLRFARDTSTCMSLQRLKAISPTMRAPAALVSSLMNLDAKSGNDDQRSTVTFVTERRFVGDDIVAWRPQAVAR